ERNYTLPYKYTFEAAKILRFVYYTYGPEKGCQLYVEILNHTTQLYSAYYTGDIDFTTANDQRDFFSVGVKETGVAASIKANEDVIYEVPITTPDKIIIDID